MNLKSKRSGTVHNFTKDNDPGYKDIENFKGGVQWCMTESKDFISKIDFQFANENGNIVSSNGKKILPDY